MKKKLILIRHGETLFNQKNIIQGWCDSPLSARGNAQARAAGEALASLQLSSPSFWCSPSGRTLETMRWITSEDVNIDPGLKEMNFGLLEGENCAILPMDDHEAFMNSFTAFQGDGPEDVWQRMEKTLKNILEEDPADTVICVSHGVAIAEFLRHCTDLSIDDFCWANCALQILDYEDGTFRFSSCLADHCAV